MRSVSASLATALSLVIAGCVTYSERLRIEADGSGTVAARLVVAEEALGRAPTIGPYSAGRILSRLSRENLEQTLNQDGITLRRLVVDRNDTSRIWEVEYAFSDLDALRRARNEGRDVALRQYDATSYEFNLVFSPVDRLPTDSSEPQAAAPEQEQNNGGSGISAEDSISLTRVLPGFVATIDIEMPTEVLSAPRGRFAGNRAAFVWSYERDGIFVLGRKTMRVIFRRGTLDWPTFEALPASPGGQGFSEDNY